MRCANAYLQFRTPTGAEGTKLIQGGCPVLGDRFKHTLT